MKFDKIAPAVRFDLIGKIIIEIMDSFIDENKVLPELTFKQYLKEIFTAEEIKENRDALIGAMRNLIDEFGPFCQEKFATYLGENYPDFSDWYTEKELPPDESK